jgi:hypothetical protein
LNSLLLTITLGVSGVVNPAPQHVLAGGTALVVASPPVQKPQEPKDPAGTPDSEATPSPRASEGDGDPEAAPSSPEASPDADPPEGPDANTDASSEQPRDWDGAGEEVELPGREPSVRVVQRPEDPEDEASEHDGMQAEDGPPVRPEYGPFYEGEPASDIRRPGERTKEGPALSLGKGAFCFVEDSNCRSALIIDADVGAGLNVVTSEHGLDVPYTQFRVRWGATLRPVAIARGRFHPWGIGAVGSWSIGSSSIIPGDETTEAQELAPIEAYRVALINQIWFTQKKNGTHLDISLGAVNSPVLEFSGRFWGTHAEAAIGFGGWGQIFFGADFLDRDVRAITGFRGHGIFTGPLVALVLVGLVAGGVAL